MMNPPSKFDLLYARREIERAMSRCPSDTYFTADSVVDLVRKGGSILPERWIRESLENYWSHIARRGVGNT